jgi:L-threonylcarbamoyladenylate synthase
MKAAGARSPNRMIPDAEEARIAEAVAAIRAGEVVVCPTETFYALAADSRLPGSLEKIFELKGRDAAKTIALIAADAEMAFSIAREVPHSARRLARKFWPGPLTLVMPARHDLPKALIGPDGGVGVRVSPDPIASALARALGAPITATSANLSGAPPAVTLDPIRQAFGGKIKVMLDGGRLPGGAPSTLVACRADGYEILREGAISRGAIAAALADEV